jgi:heat shock protein HtpX
MRSRLSAALIGLGVLVGHTVVALGGVLVLAWVAANPPGLVPAVVAFVVGVLIAAYVGYRAGTVRLIASLRARELTRQQAPDLHRATDRLVERMGVDRPPLLVADLDAPNALSVGGPRRGAVILDRSLLRLLSFEELEGILAHELAHMERRDTLVNTLALTGVRALTGLVMLVLLPVVVFLSGIDRAAGWFAGQPDQRLGLAALFQQFVVLLLGGALSLATLGYLAYSRRQEYAADRRAAEVTGQPAALARALAKIQRASDPRTGLLSVLYTHDNRRDGDRLLSTHPPLDRRIDRLLDRTEHAQRVRPSRAA